MVVDNQRVLELPLNGRQTLDLVHDGHGGLGRNTGWRARRGHVHVAGNHCRGRRSAERHGVSLDGATHTDPFNGSSLPLPFPEALQEFKVETSALPAQYGHHSAAVVNAVTKSGTNTLSGGVFEFVRDDALNATDPFAPLGPDGERRSDGLNRNQFGGSVGGPIVRDRLFYFLAYQRTRIRRVPASSFQHVPTQAMLNGDFTAIASAACNTSGAISLRAPFVGNKINPALFLRRHWRWRASCRKRTIPAARSSSTASTTVTKTSSRPKSTIRSPTDNQSSVGCSFQTTSRRATTTGRRSCRPPGPPMDGAYSGVFGHQFLISNTTVNAFRVTVNRGPHQRYVPLLDYNDIGVKATPVLPEYLRLSVSGGFSMSPGLPTATPTWCPGLGRPEHPSRRSSVRVRRELHLLAIRPGVYTSAAGNTSFNGGVTGLGLADFMIGRANQFTAGTRRGRRCAPTTSAYTSRTAGPCLRT